MGWIISKLWLWRSPEPIGIDDNASTKRRSYDEPNSRYEPEATPLIKPAEPEVKEVKEVQRVLETKLERERVVNDAGSTTEKTQYTQYVESTKVQEPKEHVSEKFNSHAQEAHPPSSEAGPKPSVEEKKLEITVVQEPDEASDEGNVNDAIVKIQAGVRGYLTRKALKEASKEPVDELPLIEPVVISETAPTASVTFATPLIAPVTISSSQKGKEEEEEEEKEEEEEEEEDEDEDVVVVLQKKPIVPVVKPQETIRAPVKPETQEEEEEEEEEEEDEEEEEEEEEDSQANTVVKVQATIPLRKDQNIPPSTKMTGTTAQPKTVVLKDEDADDSS